MDEKVKWTNLTPSQIAERITENGLCVSKTVTSKLLIKHEYRKRKMQKTRTMGEYKERNEQFENIFSLRRSYEASNDPILSVDTKKKEMIGPFYRDGTVYATESIEVYDHDFPSFAEGVAIPHGIYDIKRNTGYVNIGTSKDTSEFACDSIRLWWLNEGKLLYPKAKSILILFDSGGSNNIRHYIFKEDIIALSNEIGIEIRIAHYPPYTSKYNPIEHKLFPHITRACKGVPLTSIEIVKELIEKTSTKKGLSVKVNIIKKEYQTERKYQDSFKKNINNNPRIKFHEKLPKLNYSVFPENFQFN